MKRRKKLLIIISLFFFTSSVFSFDAVVSSSSNHYHHESNLLDIKHIHEHSHGGLVHTHSHSGISFSPVFFIPSMEAKNEHMDIKTKNYYELDTLVQNDLISKLFKPPRFS